MNDGQLSSKTEATQSTNCLLPQTWLRLIRKVLFYPFHFHTSDHAEALSDSLVIPSQASDHSRSNPAPNSRRFPELLIFTRLVCWISHQHINGSLRVPKAQSPRSVKYQFNGNEKRGLRVAVAV
ncbi:hypothetical protein PoB_005768600 [Plakobranchus ocellatus]|uniref:Uncharacterized protein n=1 Tax=Plakobranchus ocellatus TaxID=259542 RepID=A0AAV4C7B9_9GAST|nr:hypothetical protein PoB_005768600 [Plakobranchus ocellatus]